MSFIVLVLFLALLWLAGGASLGDQLGQVVVRAGATSVLIVCILFGRRPRIARAAPVVCLLSAAVLLPLVQLVPLPPAIWQTLPGRDLFAQAALISGQDQPWRPLAIVPGAAVNAAGSLIIPIATMVLVLQLPEGERKWVPGLLLALVATSTLVGLLQLSGGGLNNPFINDKAGAVSGIFANRNHFALFLAIGCMLAPAWAFSEGREPGWRAPAALGLVLLFSLMILALGSRAGLVLGLLALVLGLLIVRGSAVRALRQYPRWVIPTLVVGGLAVVLIVVLTSIAAGRAVSLDRLVEVDQAQDMRSRALPVILEMIRTYFPVGSGLGGFDPIFRIHEPFELLTVAYFNHAHNDYLEIALDAGILGILLVLAALCWWARTSFAAWRAGPGTGRAVPRLGSSILLLIAIASIVDYPARTPTMMAIIIVASIWLSGGGERPSPAALPRSVDSL